MIRRFRVRNFKSYRDAEFEFGKVNVVMGPNGSGKTNLVDAFSALKQLVRPVSLPPFPFAKWGTTGTRSSCRTRTLTSPSSWTGLIRTRSTTTRSHWTVRG